jgi:hypothetical protein
MARSLAASLALVALVSLGEARLFNRLLYEGHNDYDFVVVNVKGVLEGRPVSKSWQQRLIAPAAALALTRLTHDPVASLELLGGALALAANVLLFALAVRERKSHERALILVALFGLVHALLMYRLEYPWDWVDIILFIAFGWWAKHDKGLLRFSPLLFVGLFNHETILYVPLWYLLSPIEKPLSQSKKDLLKGFMVALVLGASILWIRSRLYLGRPELPDQVFEEATPLIGNHLHIAHNLGQLFVEDWRSGRAFISATVLTAIALLVRRALQRSRAAIWSLCVLASIVCFGYVNETRHYLLLVAFWFAHSI